MGGGGRSLCRTPMCASVGGTSIHSIVRRSRGHAQSVIQTGELVVNLDTKTVEVNSARVHLSSKEYQMLELLSLRKGTPLSKGMFLNHLYGGIDEPEVKIIDVFICKLRKKLANASNGKNFVGGRDQHLTPNMLRASIRRTDMPLSYPQPFVSMQTAALEMLLGDIQRVDKGQTGGKFDVCLTTNGTLEPTGSCFVFLQSVCGSRKPGSQRRSTRWRSPV